MGHFWQNLAGSSRLHWSDISTILYEIKNWVILNEKLEKYEKS